MEQVTEAVKAETTENRENREYRKPAVKWLIIGLIVSLAASGIFTACYGIFERRAESRRNEQYIADPHTGQGIPACKFWARIPA